MSTSSLVAPSVLHTPGGDLRYVRLASLADSGVADPSRAPHTVKILLENLLRRAGTRDVTEDDVRALAAWPAPAGSIAFMPGRVLMQDFTGVPAVVDLAAMRSAVAREGGDPSSVNPSIPVDLVIDHSVQVDVFRSPDAFAINVEREYERNGERYRLLRWAQQAFDGVRVVPPGAGICHQVNLEHLGTVVAVRDGVAFPDTIVGTDSHTTMINGLGILGWGVGGIEAEAAMLGQPIPLPHPDVIGVRVTGALPTGATATDLVLTLTQMLRAHGVVGRFVEFFGEGLSTLPVADRATLSNMCPEYGATAAYFPVDAETLAYLRFTDRGDLVPLVEAYSKEQGLFRTDDDDDPVFTEVLELDLGTIEPSLAGPSRPQDRVSLEGAWPSFVERFGDRREAQAGEVRDGTVVITAITSCTNTSNPGVMLAAGIIARRAVEAGLVTKPWVKTSLAPGSKVVTGYLERAGLTPYLEKLGFGLVGYGCTTCIGNSGPLPDDVASAIDDGDLNVVAVLSGNRNFEGRVHPQVRAAYLASPPLVVAYALAGRLDVDLTRDPLGIGHGGPVMLGDLWPTPEEVAALIRDAVTPEQFEEGYDSVWDGDERWRSLETPTGPVFSWDAASTYVREPPFFEGEPHTIGDIRGARALVMVGDSITTDHISPAGSIKVGSPAATYLTERGVGPAAFNSYGARRGNHEVMIRGTFANVRLRNALAPGTEGSWTTHLPTGEVVTIFEAAERYAEDGTPLVVIAGREYGSGSSRDWAAKGPLLLGVRAVIAQSYERIHRSNLVGMGILPLQFVPGQDAAGLGIDGTETFDIAGLSGGITPGQTVEVRAARSDGTTVSFEATLRVDGPAEVAALGDGGILRAVMARIGRSDRRAPDARRAGADGSRPTRGT
jgi:aconitate hydratase